jgi:4-hydroxy-3-polyprenylbenzoate decarboxylase
MAYKDLQEFVARLEQEGELVRIKTQVDPELEITEIADRVSKAYGDNTRKPLDALPANSM